MYTLNQNNLNAFNTIKRASSYTVVSALNCMDSKITSKGFGIAYVMDGTENYTLNNKRYAVNKGSYLLANHNGEGKVFIDSPEMVKGICVKLQPDILSNAVASVLQPNNPFADSSLDKFFNTPSFLNNVYESQNTQLGFLLQNLAHAVSQNNKEDLALDESFYLEIASCIVKDHIPIFKQLQNIHSIKDETKKELYLRLQKGKDFMDAHFNLPLKVEIIAKQATLSEFHFYRLFKHVFKISPHQYLIKKRLNKGMTILTKDRYSVTDAASAAGFGDVYSFSKAFKKEFGIVPSQVR